MTAPGDRRGGHGSPYDAALRYLYGLQYRGIKVGLRNIRALVAHAGHPERSFPVFHCAGTNGKGSTSAFLASILTEAGYRTGLYTSPHLVHFTERIRVDGEPIPEEWLAAAVRGLRPVIEETGATFFEATTCIAFQYFAGRAVDVAVIETGLGGRLDATNVVLPVAAIITTIGLDHQEYLGRTVTRIAGEKAGIIKTGAPVVTGVRGEALGVIRAVARKRRAALIQPGDAVDVRVVGGKGGHPVIQATGGPWGEVTGRLGLVGAHQAENAALALSALAVACRKGLFGRVTAGSVRRGLARVRENTGLRARLEKLQHQGVELLLDVGHNPDGIRAATGGGLRSGKRFAVALFGAMRDKDTGAMLRLVGECAEAVVVVRPATPRAATVRELARQAKTHGMRVVAGGGVREGLRKALALARKAGGGRNGRLLVIGSHYLAGDVLQELEKTP